MLKYFKSEFFTNRPDLKVTETFSSNWDNLRSMREFRSSAKRRDHQPQFVSLTQLETNPNSVSLRQITILSVKRNEKRKRASNCRSALLKNAGEVCAAFLLKELECSNSTPVVVLGAGGEDAGRIEAEVKKATEGRLGYSVRCYPESISKQVLMKGFSVDGFLSDPLAYDDTLAVRRARDFLESVGVQPLGPKTGQSLQNEDFAQYLYP